jgi:DnaD/phage-associated family protein
LFTVYSECDLGSTLISNLFIDKYMKDANDAQLKVYLYLLRMMNAGRTTSIPDMADQFNHTEREVLRSLRYWERRGLIELEYSAAGELMSLHMISPKPEKTGQAYPVPFSSGRDMDEDDESAVGFDPVPRSAPAMPRLKEMAIAAQHAAPAQTLSSSLPEKEKELPAEQKTSLKHPDAASVEAFRSSAKRAQLLFVIEQYIGKPLAPSEVESVYYISEQLHFSDALIDYLLQYCIDRGKKDFRYIQKVAVNWAENGITTPKQAERAVSSFGRNRRGATGSGVKASANPFNQFEQNQYDFDQLEKEILGN